MHVTSVPFLVRFNNFLLTMDFTIGVTCSYSSLLGSIILSPCMDTAISEGYKGHPDMHVWPPSTLTPFPSVRYDAPANLSGHKRKLHDSSFNCGYTVRTASALTSHVSWGGGKGGTWFLTRLNKDVFRYRCVNVC